MSESDNVWIRIWTPYHIPILSTWNMRPLGFPSLKGHLNPKWAFLYAFSYFDSSIKYDHVADTQFKFRPIQRLKLFQINFCRYDTATAYDFIILELYIEIELLWFAGGAP